ncbi:PQQ-binding-like beta-propeller repeat protein [candidate division KSB1 bacterium]|nr:PQQ-binding-like beta-propeller repeat protein [candidate division KSB1 bacterium]
MWTDFGGDKLPIWAITQCPLVYGDFVIVLSQAPDAGAVAYNKLTGAVTWKTPNLGNESYASPSVAKIDGKDHIVMVISSTNPIGHRELPQTLGKVVGIEPLTGKVLWEYNEWKCHISVPSAVDAGDNKVLVVGGYELGAVMIKVEKKTDGSYGTTELFRTEEFGDQTKPPILHNGYFYAQFGTNRTRDGLTCMSMDGEILWKTKRDPDFNKGSMILADGLILATDGRKILYLIEPDPSGYKPIASAELLGEQESDDPMTARFGGTLFCLFLKQVEILHEGSQHRRNLLRDILWQMEHPAYAGRKTGRYSFYPGLATFARWYRNHKIFFCHRLLCQSYG